MDARAPRVARQGLLRLVHRVAVAEVRVSGARLSADRHVLPVRRLVHRHHDRDQPLREGLPDRQGAVRRQPVDLVRGRGQVRRHHPAGLHQLRALGHQRVRQLLRLHPRQLSASATTASSSLQKKCIEPLGESQVRLRDLRRARQAPGHLRRCSPWAARPSYDWVKEYFDATDLPKHITWEEFEKKGYYVVPFPKDHKTHAGAALVRRRPQEGHSRLGPAPLGHRSGCKGLQTQYRQDRVRVPTA